MKKLSRFGRHAARVMVVLAASLAFSGCTLLERPAPGQDSRIEETAKAARGFGIPYGDMVVAGATLIASVYAAVKGHQTKAKVDRNGDGVIDEKDLPSSAT